MVFRRTLLASALVFATGCSSDDGSSSGDGGGAPPAPTTGNTSPIGNPGAPGTPGTPGGGPRNGGTQPLTPTQVSQIESGACAGWKAEVESLPALIQLVIDVSGSMDDRAPGTGNRNKWVVTRDALRDAISGLPAETGVGALYYPNRDTQRAMQARDVSQCVRVEDIIPVGILGANSDAKREELLSSLAEPRPRGSTPTHDAYKYAFDNGLNPSRLPGERYMLLITDGAPTFSQGCVGDGQTPVATNPIIEEVKRAHAAGAKTFIIGSPGSEESMDGKDARPWLSKAAMEGGTATAGCTENGPNFCHFDMTESSDFAAALKDGLAQIAGQVVSCAYSLPPAPAGRTISTESINVIVTGSGGDAELVLRDDSGDCAEGWQLVNNQVVLCDATCNRAKEDLGGKVALHFGCGSNVLPIE
jgi:hypothetical protein